VDDTEIKLSKDQWRFLAVLDAFQVPVPIEIVGALAPLLPGPLMDLLEKVEPLEWIRKPKKGFFAIGKRLPDQAKRSIKSINRKNALSGMVRRIYEQGLDQRLDPLAMLTLLDKAGKEKEAAEYEISIAHEAVKANDLQRGKSFLEKAVRRLYGNWKDGSAARLFVSAALELSNLCFSLGVGFQEMDKFLVKAQEIARFLGDMRSHALANLHLGRLYYFTDRRDDALLALSLGHEEIRELGDDDILSQSAVFLGIFFFIKGLFKEAIKHFEKAERALEEGKANILTAPTAPLFLGYCAMYLGQFHRAIGRLDYYWRLATDQGNPAVASTIQSALGTVLVLMKKFREASVHLHQAQDEARKCNNAMGMYFAGGGLALLNFVNGRTEHAYEVLRDTIQQGAGAGLIRQFSSPWILEMIYEFHRLGFDPLPEFEFSNVMKRVMKGINLHLRGVGMRLRAREKMTRGANKEDVRKDLAESEQLLESSGDRIEQAKTVFEAARLALMEKDKFEAKKLVNKARQLLGGYIDEFFPNEFKTFVDSQDPRLDPETRRQTLMHSFLTMIESLYPTESRHEILAKMLTATSAMFGAERSGLFWFEKGKFTTRPELRVACNLSQEEIASESFRSSMSMVLKAYRTREPQVGRLCLAEQTISRSNKIRSALCIPIEAQDTVYGVLYYDNSYLDDAFDFLDPSTIKHMARHTNLVVERRFHYLKVKEELDLLSSEKSIQMEEEKVRIIAQSSNMLKILEQVDHIAETDSTVLITGETGTGKELLAKRIHLFSSRCKGPFIVVDSTTIPESLLESELFGHEKGAFTGAHNRKLGRIELAHGGTLFMDEVGELSPSAQAKLLRALQEREFTRVGGSRLIKSNFRLVAATNRDLAKEVKRGRFREDIYFRLNGIPIHVPPLRERLEDIPVLARYFLEYYTKRYKRPGLKLNSSQTKKLTQYKWPGNVRELQNIIERAVLLSTHNQLQIELPPGIDNYSDNPFSDLPTLDEVQRRYIKYVIARTGGKIGGPGGAAEILGMKRTSLYSRMRLLRMHR